MRCTLSFQVAMLLCSLTVYGQSSQPPVEQKPQSQESSGQKPQSAKAYGAVDVLSDTMGADFVPYLRNTVLPTVKRNWYNLIPESARPPIRRKGKVSIEFSILKDGKVAAMKLESGGSSGDAALDRAAWSSIVASNPFPPLPSEFAGPYLTLRFRFYYNPTQNDFAVGQTSNPLTSHFGASRADSAGNPRLQPSKSGIAVTIFPHPSMTVPVGGSEVVVATVTGTTNTDVKWSISGPGCSDSTCGTVSGGLYLAPNVLPRTPSVKLTATSVADPTASASITVLIGQRLHQ